MTPRSWVAAAGILLLATVCVFYPLFRQPEGMLVGVQNGGHNDATAYFAAARGITAITRERDGQWPWWNPNLLCGVPVLGNPQSALFYPPNWVFILWRSPAAVGWMMIFHHLLAGCGTFLLCRKYGCEWFPAVVGAVCFIGAPYFVAHTGEGHFNQICAVAWVPWAFLAFERFRAGLRGGFALVATTLALSLLCGHAQESFYTGLILSAFVLLDSVALVRQGKTVPALRRLGLWCGVAGATIGLVAFEILPIWNYSKHSVRSAGISMTQASDVSLGFSHLWQIVNPVVHGGTGDGRFYWETFCHFGTVPFLLAVLGAIVAWKKYPMRRMTGLWIISLVFAFGVTLPVFPLLYHAIPGLSLFRIPSRSLFFSSFAIAILAAGGTNAIWNLREAAAGSKSFLRAGSLAGCVLAALLVVLELSGVCNAADGSTWLIALSANLSRWVYAVAFFAVVSIAIRSAQVRVRVAVVGCLLLLCVLDVSSYSRLILRVQPTSFVVNHSSVGDQIISDAGQSRVLASQHHWSDYTAVRYGVQKIQGYEPVPLSTYTMTVDALTPGQDPMNTLVGFMPVDAAKFDKKLLDLLGVRYLIASGPRPVERDGWKLLKSAAVVLPNGKKNRTRQRVVALYENPTAMPRAFVVGRVRLLKTIDSNAVEALRKVDVRQELLLDRDVLGDVPRTAYEPANIVEYTANRVSIDVEVERAGYLFLSDVWYPGWSAEIDGEPVDVLRANLAFRAVAIQPGRHHVTFQYRPRGLMLGALIALLTAGLLIAGVMPSANAAAKKDE